MGVNVGEEGRTHKINELYSVELWFAPAAQPRWHVFSRFRHNICLVFFFAFFFSEFQKEFLKNCTTPHPLTSKQAPAEHLKPYLSFI